MHPLQSLGKTYAQQDASMHSSNKACLQASTGKVATASSVPYSYVNA